MGHITCVTGITRRAERISKTENLTVLPQWTLFQWGLTNWSNTWKHACYCAFMYTFTEKHVCFHAISLFSAHFWPHWKRVHYRVLRDLMGWVPTRVQSASCVIASTDEHTRCKSANATSIPTQHRQLPYPRPSLGRASPLSTLQPPCSHLWLVFLNLQLASALLLPKMVFTLNCVRSHGKQQLDTVGSTHYKFHRPFRSYNL